MKWILNRLKERSTWSAIVALASIAGMNLNPELKEAIITAGTAIIAVIFAITADKPSTEKVQEIVDERQPVEAPQGLGSPPENAYDPNNP